MSLNWPETLLLSGNYPLRGNVQLKHSMKVKSTFSEGEFDWIGAFNSVFCLLLQINFSAFHSTYEVDTPLCSAYELEQYYKAKDKLQRSTNTSAPNTMSSPTKKLTNAGVQLPPPLPRSQPPPLTKVGRQSRDSHRVTRILFYNTLWIFNYGRIWIS